MKINPNGFKASDIRRAMQERWASPEWAIMWEVGEGTGQNSGRYADAVMMSLWPSRGLELHGVEIKVSRSDWKREAKDPTKAEAVAQFCDRWWIHTPEGVVDDISDMPPAWGLREWTGKQWRTIREAEKTDAQPVTRAFLAALLRRGDRIMKEMIRDANASIHAQMQAEHQARRELFQESVKSEVDRRTRDFAGLQRQIEAFEAAFGEKVSEWSPDMKAIGHAAAAIAKAGNNWADRRADLFQAAADGMREVAEITRAKGKEGRA